MVIKNRYQEIELISLEAAGYLCFWPVLDWKKRVYRIRSKPKTQHKPRFVYRDKDMVSWLQDMDIDFELNMKYDEKNLK